MFFDDLKNEMQPESTYQNAKETWDHFKVKIHGEFIDLYLKSDVLLLAYAFERFREVNLKYFEIDPCHCYSAPGLTWQAGLKYTNINLELLENVEILLSFENTVKCGISGVMGSRFVKSDEHHNLLYIDANNLYGWAMKQYLPEGDFKMSEPDQPIEEKEILSIPENSSIGFFFEVDLEYPESEKHKSINFPYCPESLFILDEELSIYQREVLSGPSPSVNKQLHSAL